MQEHRAVFVTPGNHELVAFNVVGLIGSLTRHRSNFRSPARELEAILDRGFGHHDFRHIGFVFVACRINNGLAVVTHKGHQIHSGRFFVRSLVCHISRHRLQRPTLEGVDRRCRRVLFRVRRKHDIIDQCTVIIEDCGLEHGTVFVFENNLILTERTVECSRVTGGAPYSIKSRSPAAIPYVIIRDRRRLGRDLISVAISLFTVVFRLFPVAVPAKAGPELIVHQFAITIVETDLVANIGNICYIFRHRFQSRITAIYVMIFFPNFIAIIIIPTPTGS